jgi:steroid 5-alpha reductase family enzyme
MIHNALVIAADLGAAALVALAVAVLRRERNLRGWWDSIGIVIFIVVFALLCLACVELGWLGKL